jgi:hypothetical protein
MFQFYYENDKNINNLKINFLKLENDLGVSGEVAMADFKTSVKTLLQIIKLTIGLK